MSKLDRTLLVCPTLNPGDVFVSWLNAYDSQSEKPAAALIIDSSSDDGSVVIAKNFGFMVDVIQKNQFNHGRTRQQAVDEHEGFEYIIFLTHDAILYNNQALSELLSVFDDVSVAAVHGRQLPRDRAGPIEKHARDFNYPAASNVRSIKDAARLGIKAAFLSNSFAAYRRDALLKVGGFPNDVIFGEDMYVAAKFLKAGYKVAYNTAACVIHSHEYTILQEFKRYFDMGVFHANEPWIRQEFGNAEGEGFRFLASEIKYLARHAIWKIPEGLLRKMFGYLGFKLGIYEKYIPLLIKKKLCMNKAYFT